ncbi:MAG: YggS family pyridoxal phosphate-dependent enzyme [Bacteroidota bacterium]|nr:YggS family pyridoxal phosphate-dependent enzyme [Bacteroidota bacterium]MDO9613806.1 YggS family pyridoxal phosphate-dependent enzyme [Bacteroidota bacterium]
MSIAENIEKVKANLPEKVRLVAVSKTKPAELLLEAYDCGQRSFGENKVQEMVWKFDELPKDIEWHFIGHLQTNKIKYIAPFVHLIHGVDSFKLLKSIDAEAKKVGRIIPCLLQFHIAEEESKFGLSMQEATEMLNSTEYKVLGNVKISGVMGMATYTDDENQIRKEFTNLKKHFEKLKLEFFTANFDFKEISMGMSGDYLIAIAEGSTMVRIGSTIFGERNYSVKP